MATISRAAELLGVPADELGRAVADAGLEPFAPHADGSPTYRWGQLTALVEGQQR